MVAAVAAARGVKHMRQEVARRACGGGKGGAAAAAASAALAARGALPFPSPPSDGASAGSSAPSPTRPRPSSRPPHRSRRRHIRDARDGQGGDDHSEDPQPRVRNEGPRERDHPEIRP